MKNNKEKKAQVQLGENVVVLIIFFFLLVIAVIFYSRVQTQKAITGQEQAFKENTLNINPL